MNGSTVTLKTVRCERTYDIVVVGGGTAGVMAAIAAAESGKDVLIAERGYALGGSSTLAQVTPYMTTRIGTERNSYLSARLQRLMEEDGTVTPPWPNAANTMFSPVAKTVTLEKMCADAGVDILYGASFVDTVRVGNRITAVLVQTLSGLMQIETAFVIDGTGDAQVAFMSGCPFEAGDAENNGHNQNMSLRFAVCGIDMQKVNQRLFEIGEDVDPASKHVYMSSVWNSLEPPLSRVFREAVDNGDLVYEDGTYFQAFSAQAYGDGVIYFNCPEAPNCRNTTDPFAVSQGVVDCRASAMRLHAFMKKYLGGFENSTLISFAQMPGIRESRRIVGEYVLSIEDYNARRKFEDGIAQSAYPVDVHGRTTVVHPQTFSPGEYFEVPYRSLVAKGVDNLLVVGRCASASFWAQSAIRIILVCHAMGEAAGIAASMALDLSCAAKQVDGAAVRAEMQARGGTFVAE